MIQEYFSQIRDQIFEHPSAIDISFNSTATDKGRGFWKAQLTFRNGSELHLFEYIVNEGENLKVKKYRYYFQNPENEMIFRYDNAPHHPEIKTHPEHKHENSHTNPAKKPEIKQVLTEVTQHIAST